MKTIHSPDLEDHVAIPYLLYEPILQADAGGHDTPEWSSRVQGHLGVEVGEETPLGTPPSMK